MINRYTRDELIMAALQMADVPSLIPIDMPDGVITEDAMSVGWLQEILDFWYTKVPFSCTIKKSTLTIAANSQTLEMPDDFILDVRDGLIVQDTSATDSKTRKYRTPLQDWITIDLSYQGRTDIKTPYWYTVLYDEELDKTIMKTTPVTNEDRSAELWYYQLPPKLGPNQRPRFVSDYIIKEYIRIRALEWCRAYEPGTAQKFCDKLVGGMKAGGLLNEPENTRIPFAHDSFLPKPNATPFTWMGPR
jgi:hypothetical protein